MNITKIGAALFRMDIAMMGEALKAKWMEKTFPFGADYRDEAARFDRLYMLRDPWSLNCESEWFRFRQTNTLILENFGHIRTLLEIGCGEGLQSSELQRVCDCLYGIDVSGRAVRRARRRCPQGVFAVADMYDLPRSAPLPRFDLVTACEVLYYRSDLASALRRISDLGRACLITYYHGARHVLDEHVRTIPGAKFETISYRETSWTVAWWRP